MPHEQGDSLSTQINLERIQERESLQVLFRHLLREAHVLLRRPTNFAEHVHNVLFLHEGEEGPAAHLLAKADHSLKERAWLRLIRRPELVSGRSALIIVMDHNAAISDFACSPGGHTIASIAVDGTICVWNPQTGKRTITLQGPADDFLALSWSPDGNWLACGNWRHPIRVWETKDWTQKVISEEIVGRPIWSPDGKKLFAGKILLDTNRWERCGYLDVDQGLVAWSPDGHYLAGVHRDKGIRVWDVMGNLTGMLSGHTEQIEALAWAPDGKTIASLGTLRDHTIRLWDVVARTQKAMLDWPEDFGLALAWSPDGSRLAAGIGSWNNDIHAWALLWDTASQERQAILKGHNRGVTYLAWSPRGDKLATGSYDGAVCLWEKATGKLLAAFRGHTGRIRGLTWSPDGSFIISGSEDGTIRLWRSDEPDIPSQELIAGDVYTAAWNPEGSLVAIGRNFPGRPDLVEIIDPQNENVQVVLKGHKDSILEAVWSPDGNRLATISLDDSIMIWRISSGECIWRLGKYKDHVAAAAWSPDSELLTFSVRLNRSVLGWNHEGETGTLFREPRLHQPNGLRNWITALAWSTDGRRLASGSAAGAIRLWSRQTWEVEATLLESPLKSSLPREGTDWSTPEGISDLFWSSDGNWLISESNSNVVSVWDTTTNCEIAHFEALFGKISCGPAGFLVLSGGDGTIMLLDILTGTRLGYAKCLSPILAVYCPSNQNVIWAIDDGATTGNRPAVYSFRMCIIGA